MECDGTVVVCCIVLFEDAAEDALLKLEPPSSRGVDLEFSGFGVTELLEEDSGEMADRDCGDVGVDDGNFNGFATFVTFATVADEFDASVIVN